MRQAFRERIRLFLEEPTWILKKGVLSAALIIGILPLIIISLYSFFSCKQYQAMEMEIQRLEKKAKNFVAAGEKRERLFKIYSAADSKFLQKKIETLDLLGEDRLTLRELEKERGEEIYEPALQRLQFLSSGENRLHFNAVGSQKSASYKGSAHYLETKWHLDHPVELNYGDIEHLLALIEGVNIGPFAPHPSRPYLMITGFQLTKKMEGESLFSLDLDLLQRDCYAKN